MYFSLLEGVDITRGKEKALIVDTKNFAYYSIDLKFYKILRKCMQGHKVELITNNPQFLILKLEELVSLKLGKLSEKFENINYNLEYKNIDMVWFNLTSLCNYKCIHCYENACNTERNSNSQLVIEDYKFIIEEILNNQEYISCVQLTGGEPLLRGKDFIKSLILLLKKYPIKTIEIYTNLSLIDMDYINFFKQNKINIATSLYSQNEDIHDTITGIKGSFNKSMKIIEMLKEKDIPVRIGAVLMPLNYQEKDTITNWVHEKLNINQVNYDVVRPVGRAKNNIENLSLFLHHNKDNNIFTPQEFKSYFYNKKFNPCWGNKVCIKNDGFVYPCIMSNIKIGNFKDINYILNGKNSYRFLNKDKITKCKSCEFRYLCSECRAIGTTNKLNIRKQPLLCKLKFIKGRKNENKA